MGVSIQLAPPGTDMHGSSRAAVWSSDRSEGGTATQNSTGGGMCGMETAQKESQET